MAQVKKPENVNENPDKKSKEFVAEAANVTLDTEEKLKELKDPVFEVATTIINTEDKLGSLIKKMQKENRNIPDAPYRTEKADV